MVPIETSATNELEQHFIYIRAQMQSIDQNLAGYRDWLSKSDNQARMLACFNDCVSDTHPCFFNLVPGNQIEPVEPYEVLFSFIVGAKEGNRQELQKLLLAVDTSDSFHSTKLHTLIVNERWSALASMIEAAGMHQLKLPILSYDKNGNSPLMLAVLMSITPNTLLDQLLDLLLSEPNYNIELIKIFRESLRMKKQFLAHRIISKCSSISEELMAIATQIQPHSLSNYSQVLMGMSILPGRSIDANSNFIIVPISAKPHLLLLHINRGVASLLATDIRPAKKQMPVLVLTGKKTENLLKIAVDETCCGIAANALREAECRPFINSKVAYAIILSYMKDKKSNMKHVSFCQEIEKFLVKEPSSVTLLDRFEATSEVMIKSEKTWVVVSGFHAKFDGKIAYVLGINESERYCVRLFDKTWATGSFDIFVEPSKLIPVVEGMAVLSDQLSSEDGPWKISGEISYDHSQPVIDVESDGMVFTAQPISDLVIVTGSENKPSVVNGSLFSSTVKQAEKASQLASN